MAKRYDIKWDDEVITCRAYCDDGDHVDHSDYAALQQSHARLLEALTMMEVEKSDYMTRNNLGDPAKEHTNKHARAAIAAAQPFTET